MTQNTQTFCNKCQEVGQKIAIDLKKEGNYWNHYVAGTNYSQRHWHVLECKGCKKLGINNVLIVLAPFRRNDGSTGWKPQNPNGTEHKHGEVAPGVPAPYIPPRGHELELEQESLEAFKQIEIERADADADRDGDEVPIVDMSMARDEYNYGEPHPRPAAYQAAATAVMQLSAEELTLKAIQSVVNTIYEKQIDMNDKLDKILAEINEGID